MQMMSFFWFVVFTVDSLGRSVFVVEESYKIYNIYVNLFVFFLLPLFACLLASNKKKKEMPNQS